MLGSGCVFAVKSSEVPGHVWLRIRQRGSVMSGIGASNGLLTTCFICSLFCACGGGGSQSPSSKLVVVVQNPGIQLGASEQLHAQLVRSDGSTQDVTNSVNWSSS